MYMVNRINHIKHDNEHVMWFDHLQSSIPFLPSFGWNISCGKADSWAISPSYIDRRSRWGIKPWHFIKLLILGFQSLIVPISPVDPSRSSPSQPLDWASPSRNQRGVWFTCMKNVLCGNCIVAPVVIPYLTQSQQVEWRPTKFVITLPVPIIVILHFRHV